jgi:hypothetical protein
VLSVAASTLGMALVLRGRWGHDASWASGALAPCLAAFVLTGAFPFLLGTALATFALHGAQRQRWRAFFALGALTAAASPLAFLLLALIVLAVALGERPRRGSWTPGLVIIGAIGAFQLLLNLLFASGSHYPFPTGSLVQSVVFCVALTAVCWRVPAAGAMRWLGLVLGAACLLAFVMPSALGEGITRFRFAAVPIAVLALSLRRWQPVPLSIAFLAAASFWNAAPLVGAVANGLEDPSDGAAYWSPATGFLRSHLRPGERVEVVDTERHWAAAYLPAAGIPMVRGWFLVRTTSPRTRCSIGLLALRVAACEGLGEVVVGLANGGRMLLQRS